LCTNKQLLTILSRTEQLKGCTAASRMPFAHAPPQQLGPRSNLLCSSDSEHSREKTLVFPQLKQFLALPLCCQMNFCKTKKCQLMLLSKFVLKLCMFLLFLCPGTILAPSCRASCQASSSLPPLSGSVGAVSSQPFIWSTTAPTPSCTAAPASSPSELGPGVRLSPSAASRLARLQMPHLASRVAAADRWICRQAVLPQPSRSHFQTCWFFHLLLQCRHEMVPEPFSYPARRFCMTGTGGAITGATDVVPVPYTGTATEVGPLTSSPVDTCPWQWSDQSGVLQ
jgi:hypothetical protein